MCGFAGLWDPLARAEEARGRVARMRDVLRSRGPDDEGAWSDPPAGIYLGHRRLSILDLNPIAAQPMGSASGRYQIVYNGEVYNFRALREQLGVRSWRTDGDTEVVLAAIEAWGLEPALGRFVGMFAFALWDAQERSLTLVRDRLGIKPLVYGHHGGALLFGSTLAALAAHPNHDDALDRGALAGFLRLSCVPAPHTIYRADRKVRPGSYLRFSDATAAGRETRYWDAASLRRHATPLAADDEEATDRVEQALREAVSDRLVSDVPVGAFLSGGIDSSLVTALMRSSGHRVRTFSIGNERADYDESAAARAVSDHLGTDHTELIVTGADALALIPKLAELTDEPFADPSLLPTYLVSQLAREHVTVALSGDGGDELFGGYNRHFWGPVIWRALHMIPTSARTLSAHAIKALSPARWDALLTGAGRLAFPVRLPGDKLHKLAGVLASPDSDAFYLGLQSHFHDPLSALAGPAVLEARPPDVSPSPDDFAERMMLGDLLRYLPDDILTKVDRASMAVSLEARVPLLDHRVVELSWRLPARLKAGRDGRLGRVLGKRVLRRVLARHVPEGLFDRPKMGFGVPVSDWLRGPLREWADDLLDPTRLRDDGVFSAAPLRARWVEHRSGRRDHATTLWSVLMFQSWLASRG